MATHRVFGLFIALAGLALAMALAGRRTHGANDDFRFDAAELKDRSSWTQVNTEPYRLSASIDALCAAPTAADYESERKRNPHAASYVTVYVNNVGRKMMFAKEVQRFPEGSVIVKEKMGDYLESSKPLLYTIMRKRERGYNPKVGDWEFSVAGANGTELQAIGKLENCQSCHQAKTDSDFVFRPYLKSK
jgi:hypothetical protein